MIKFNKPEIFNGTQLIAELSAQKINVVGNPLEYADGSLFLDIDSKDEEKVKVLIASHVGVDTAPSLDEKLASVGLSVTDLKEALGL